MQGHVPPAELVVKPPERIGIQVLGERGRDRGDLQAVRMALTRSVYAPRPTLLRSRFSARRSAADSLVML